MNKYRVRAIYDYDEDGFPLVIEKLVHANSHIQAEERFIKWIDKYHSHMLQYIKNNIMVYENNINED